MLQPRMLALVALVGLLASTAMSTPASAEQRAYYRGSSGGHYRSEPQVRLGVDVVWGGYGGGYGYAPPHPPLVWYPAYYAPDRYYDQGHGRGQYRRHKHRRHPHHAERWDNCDD